MSITKTSNINKQNMLLAHGSKDTLIHQPNSEYKGISLKEIAAMVSDPQAVEKADAAFIIPSTYRKHDGRNHAAQRERGEYWMLAIDVDKGSPSLTDVKDAVILLTNDAAALIYSSSGASEDERKWRVLIPLAEPLTGKEYVEAQMALFAMMEDEHGIICDAALSRSGQPIYLPNVPPARRDDLGAPLFYHGVKHRGQGYLSVKESRIWATVEFNRQQAEIAERKAAVEREQRMQKRAEREASGDVDVVAEFNARHSVADTLLHYGYEKDGRSPHYRSRYQTTGSFATKDFGDYWVSMSMSDAAAGVGALSGAESKSTCWGDAFDLYCHYEHNGNMTAAVRAYAAEIKPSPFEKVNEQIASSNYDDFDFYPDEPEPEQEPEQAATVQEWPTPVRRISESLLPRRRWVYAHHHIRGFVSVTASAGGIGKTSLTMVEAMAVALGKNLLGEDVKEQTNAWVINLEDPRIELELRLAAAMKHYGVAYDDIAGKLFMDGEDDIGITLAVENRDGIMQNDEFLSFMIRKIKENNIGLVIIDPFVSVHEVNENSNTAIQVVVAMLRKLARETDAAIHVVHHVRKGNGDDATIDSVRGAGALIGAARAARVINRVSSADASRLGVPEVEARGLFRVDDGKANLAPPAEAAVYRRMIGVKLDNDEWVGVAAAYALPDQWAGMTDRVANDILNQIDAGLEDGEKWSMRPQDKSRWVGTLIMKYKFSNLDHVKTDGQAKAILRQWMEEGLIEEVEYHSEKQRKTRKGVVSTGRVGEQN